MSRSSSEKEEKPRLPCRYRIRTLPGGKVKIKFKESFSTSLDDDLLLPDDNETPEQRRELGEPLQFDVAKRSLPLIQVTDSHTDFINKNNEEYKNCDFNVDNEDKDNVDSKYNEQKRLMSYDSKVNYHYSNSKQNNFSDCKRNGESKKKVYASGSIQLPSTTVGETTSPETNCGADCNSELDEFCNYNNDQNSENLLFIAGDASKIVRMRSDIPYAMRTVHGNCSGAGAMSLRQPALRGGPRMGRRFTLNPLIFAKEQRDARRQSLAQLKLSYYPSNANPDIYDAGLGICSWSLMCLSWVFFLLTFPLSVCFCVKVVQEYERAVIFRLGRLIGGGARGPGIFFVMPCIESYTKVDLRTVSFSVPPQEILTRDSVTVSVDAVVYYRICNATVSVANVENAHHSTRLLAQTTLRNMLGTRNLSEILSDRDNIAGAMQTLLDEATESWGIKVERVEIKDVRLPIQLQRAMAAEAEATREARAKVIAAEGEQKASRALRDAASVIAMSPAAIQLRYLQTLNSVAAEKNSTIIFPLPIELIRYWIGGNNKKA